MDNQFTQKSVCLFSISSLGLGHATRSLAVIEAYLPTHEIHIISTGNALAYLRQELQDKGVIFHELLDYPPLERGKGLFYYAYLVIDSLVTLRVIKKEHRFVRTLCKKIAPQFIVSDGRYGSYVKGIPSFIISHQISFIMPKGFGFFQKIADYFNYKTFRKFNCVCIPDYEDANANLAGKLSHNRILSKLNHKYIGILSSLKRESIQKDADFLFSLSGYLEEHKASFVSTLMEHAKNLSGKKVFILGDSRAGYQKNEIGDGIEVLSSVSGKERRELYNRARFVVSRSGYTTIMDLTELGIPGFLIPTPGQTEQEYLAEYLGNKKYFMVPGSGLDLTLLRSATKISPFTPPWTTEKSVENIKKIVSENMATKA